MSRVAPLPALLATVAVALALAVTAPAAAAATVANGDFESGSLEGWQLEESGGGAWSAFGGTVAPASGETVPAPFEGSYAALADDTGPASLILYQDVYLEPGETHELSLELNYKSNVPIVVPSPDTLSLETTEIEGEPVQRNQQVRVDVMTGDSAVASLEPEDVLETLFATAEGDPQEAGWTHLEADLSEFAGQTVRIRIAVVAAVEVLDVGVDAVSIVSSPEEGNEPESEPEPQSGPEPGPSFTVTPGSTDVASGSPAIVASVPRCVAPKLKGMSLKAAKQAIRSAGCTVGHVGRRKGVAAASAIVVRQFPKPGTAGAAGSRVAVGLG